MRRNYMVLFVAFAIALVVSLVMYNHIKNSQPVKAPVETQSVVIAAADIPWGTKISSEMIKKIDIPKGNFFSGCFSDTSKVVGRVALYPINSNEPVLESRLAPLPTPGAGVAAIVAMKKRAVAIKVDKTIGVSGFIHPGNRVDMLVTLPEINVTKTILENLLVLAVGVEVTEKTGKGERPMNTDVITVELTPDEAERLALASSQGKILLTLRNYGDSENVLTKGVQISTLLNAYSSSPFTVGGKGSKVVAVKAATSDYSKKKEEPLKKKEFVVELIKGSKRSEVKFDDDSTSE